jgi:hypothetical protein
MTLLPAQAADLMNALDTDGSGTIDLEEFKAVFQLAQEEEAEQKEVALQSPVNNCSRPMSAERMAVGLWGNRGGGTTMTKHWGGSYDRARTTSHGNLARGVNEIPSLHGSFSKAARPSNKQTQAAPVSKAAGLIRYCM